MFRFFAIYEFLAVELDRRALAISIFHPADFGVGQTQHAYVAAGEAGAGSLASVEREEHAKKNRFSGYRSS